jgi:hypothetical protein
MYEDQIDGVLAELQDIESSKVKEYVRKLTPDPRVSAGEQYRQMVDGV